MAAKFVITKDKKGEFRFKLVASNGETIATSEGYKAKAGVKNCIESIKKNAAGAEIVDETAQVYTFPEDHKGEQVNLLPLIKIVNMLVPFGWN